jgi:hypothetical protein
MTPAGIGNQEELDTHAPTRERALRRYGADACIGQEPSRPTCMNHVKIADNGRYIILGLASASKRRT